MDLKNAGRTSVWNTEYGTVFPVLLIGSDVYIQDHLKCPCDKKKNTSFFPSDFESVFA